MNTKIESRILSYVGNSRQEGARLPKSVSYMFQYGERSSLIPKPPCVPHVHLRGDWYEPRET